MKKFAILFVVLLAWCYTLQAEDVTDSIVSIYIMDDPPSCGPCFHTLHNLFERTGLYRKKGIGFYFITTVQPPSGGEEMVFRSHNRIHTIVVDSLEVFLNQLRNQNHQIRDHNTNQTPYVLILRGDEVNLFPYKDLFSSSRRINHGFVDFILQEVWE